MASMYSVRRLPKRLLLARAIRAAGYTPGHKYLAECAEAGFFHRYEPAEIYVPQDRLVKALRVLGEHYLAFQVIAGVWADTFEDAIEWLAKLSQRVEAIKAKRVEEEECVLELESSWQDPSSLLDHLEPESLQAVQMV